MSREPNSKMPNEIGDTYDALERELSWYGRSLTALYELYVDKQKNVELFNDIAPDFFGFIQRTLIDSLIVLRGAKRLHTPASPVTDLSEIEPPAKPSRSWAACTCPAVAFGGGG